MVELSVYYLSIVAIEFDFQNMTAPRLILTLQSKTRYSPISKYVWL
jgi:hypothetical protein